MFRFTGSLHALEVWRKGDNLRAYVVVELLAGNFRLWTGQGADAVVPLLTRVAAETDPMGLGIPAELAEAPGWTRHADDWSISTAARRVAGRTLRSDIGGDDGWVPVYGGPAVLRPSELPVERSTAGFDSTLPEEESPEEAPPEPEPLADEFTTDLDAIRARRMAMLRRRTAEVAKEKVAVALEEAGVRLVRAYHTAKAGVVCNVPVTARLGDQRFEGNVIRNNPVFATIQVSTTDAAKMGDNPVSWHYGNGTTLIVGISGSHGERQ